jgi:hypothetical protein
MIGARFGSAVALVLSVVAVALAFAAFMVALRDDGVERGRVLQTRVSRASLGDPVNFPLDEFYISLGGDGIMRALYVYPPGFYGHSRGCKVVWAANERVDGAANGPGMFIDPCGGARFDRQGRLVAGPADRGLDYFATEAGVEGVIVDTRDLFCGPPYEESARQLEPSPTPTAGIPGLPPVVGTLVASATPQPSPSPTPSAETTGEADDDDERCDRVSPDTKRPTL